jgi:methyl-accepting chemotaxis protein
MVRQELKGMTGEIQVMRMTLGKKLVVWGMALVLLPLFVVGSFCVWRMAGTLTRFAEKESVRKVHELTDVTRLILEKELSQVRGLSALDKINKVADKIQKEGVGSAANEIQALNDELFAILKHLGDQYSGAFVTDAGGTAFSGVKADGNHQEYKGLNIAEREYFKKARQDGKVDIAPIVRSKVSKQPVMIVYAPLKSEKGEFLGLFCLTSKVDFLINLIAETKMGDTGYAFMIDDKGNVIAHPKKEFILERNLASEKGLEAIAAEMMSQKEGTRSYLFEGTEKVTSFAPVGIKPWSIAVCQSKKELMSEVDRLMKESLLIGAVLICIAMVSVFFFSRSITRPVQRAVKELTEGFIAVAGAASAISIGSQQLAGGASEQAASIEETSSSLEEMASMTRQNAENAAQANKLMSEAGRVTEQANHSMDSLTSSMTEISRASDEISKIIRTIDEIAFQTNLLALNAAVEAARAGEAGAGFAVVADEVRNLAMRAADAAKSTADLIESTVKKVKEGSDLVAKTNEDFRQVAATVTMSGDLVSEITAASQEQAQGIEQVNKAVAEMDKVVQQNAANAEESASSSEEMHAQTDQMKKIVSDLAALVGGDGNGEKQSPPMRKEQIQETVSPQLPKKLLSSSGKGSGRGNGSALTYSKRGAKEVRPEQVIPFDDESSSDF